MSSRFTTNAGASCDQHARLRSCLPTANAVARVASSVRSPRTISSSGSTATGLKKWKPTTRSGCSSSAAIAVTDSEEVLVASTASGETIFSSSAQTCFLTSRSSKTASMTKSASAKTDLSTEPLTRPYSLAAVPLSIRPLPTELLDLGVHVAHALVDPGLVQVGQDDRHLSRRANSSASWLAIRPAPTMPTLVTGAGQALVRRAGRPLGPPLHQVEGVQAAAQLLG